MVALAALLLLAGAAAGQDPCVEGPAQWSFAAGGNGHQYDFICTPSTWDDARVAAETLGCTLATITSAAENAFVDGVAGPLNGWIGGSQPLDPDPDLDPAANWEWVTGEPFVFTNWNSAEPNDDTNEDCLEFRDQGNWNDLNCSDTGQRGYIVECVNPTIAAIPTVSPFGLMALVGALWLGAMLTLRRLRRRSV